jgi:succinyl-diaminopimelate desuccinylase
MLTEAEKRVSQRVLALKDELIDVLSQLVSINTADPPGENYEQIARFLFTYLEELADKAEIVQASSESLIEQAVKPLNRPIVLAEIIAPGTSPVLHFNGHYDVVPATDGWDTDPYQPTIKADRLYGRGSSDMKSGIAAMLVAVKALRVEGINLGGTISFSFVPDEERDGPAGTRFLLEQKGIPADYCIIGEPTYSTDFYNGHKGCLWLEVTTEGKAAHGSSPWRGINAFDEMIEFVSEVNTKIKPKLIHQSDTEINPSTASKKGAITLGGQISSGKLPNVVPSQCKMTIDRRLAPGESAKKALADFNSIIRSLKERDSKFSGDIRVLSQYEACITPAESPLVSLLKQSIKSVTGKTPKISLMTAGCDLRYFHAAGIPTVIYGPGNSSVVHQANEFVEIDRLITAAQVYALTAIRILGIGN